MDDPDRMLHSAVVKVYATSQQADYDSPWQSHAPHSGTGSGVVVGPGHVLTGAHVVADATFLQVQKHADPDKYPARIQSVSHDADLALLRIDHAGFMDGVVPMRIGGLPDLRDRVSVVGYPIGGEEISVTEGVVSRIEVQRYSHSNRNLLAVTVDAAINDGNSGGPVLHEGKIVGIAFQSLEDAENIGEMVPAPLLAQFLEGVERGRVPAVPGLGIWTQTLENPVLRQSLGLAADRAGVLVRAVDFGCSAWGSLRRGDVLLGVDGQAIASNGTIRYQGRHRTSFEVVLAEHHIGDELGVTVWRDGVVHEIALRLLPFCSLVPRNSYDRSPTWFIFGGLVFQILNRDYLRTWNKWWNQAPKEFLYEYHYGKRTPERQEIVILSQVLADEINIGYETFHNESIVRVNGVPPVDMRDFVRRMDACRGPLPLHLETSLGSTLVLDTDAAREASPRILARYHIGADRSADLLAGA